MTFRPNAAWIGSDRFQIAMARGFLALSLAAFGEHETAKAQDAARAHGTWTARAPLPEARTELSAASDGRYVYVVGGFARGRLGFGTTAPRGLFAYDPASDRWRSLGDIPEGVNHAGLAVAGGRLYIVGGYRETNFEPIDSVHIYDLSSGVWRRAAPLPTPRGALAVAVHDGKIHAIGGTAASRRSVATHEVYDPATDLWRAAASMPTARNHHAAAALDGRLYVAGGRDGGDFELRVNEVYDPGSDRWTAAAPLPTGRSGIAAAVLDGRMYVFGGETFGGGAHTFDDAERYDPARDRWEILPPMATARHGLGAAQLGGAIYVIGGGPMPGLTYSAANERLNPAPAR